MNSLNNDTRLKHLRLFLVSLWLTAPSLSTLPRVADGSETDDRILAETYAPLVRLHPDEQFFPDSAENYLLGADPYGVFKHSTDQEQYLVSIDDLGSSPYSNPFTLPHYFQGNGYGVESGEVPIYSYIKDVTSDVTDILYAMYYPYNEGKKICEAMELDLVDLTARADTSITPETKITLPTLVFDSSLLCTGSNRTLLDVYFASIHFTLGGVPANLLDTTFGNHPTDAEYYMVRLKNGQPIKIMTGAHGKYVVHDWHDVAKEGETHAIIYAGRGGHGTFISAGKQSTLVESKPFSEGVSESVGVWHFSLSGSASVSGAANIYSIDYTANGGIEWQTWDNVETFRWESLDNLEGYPQYPWVAEYDAVHWGSPKSGEEPTIVFGVDLSVGISKRFCAGFLGCKTLSFRKTGRLDETLTIADEKELSGTDGSVKIGRADDMFKEIYNQLRP